MAATSFINPVLEYLWSFLNAIIGILIIYEIVKLIGSFGKGSSSTNYDNFTKDEKNIEKDEKKDIDKIIQDENGEANSTDRAIKFGGEFHKKIQKIIEYLTIAARKVRENRITKKELQDDLELVIKSLNTSVGTINRYATSANWAYQRVTNEFKLLDDLWNLIDDQNKALGVLSTKLEKLPDGPSKTQLVSRLATLYGRVNSFSDEIKVLRENCRKRAQEVYIVLKEIPKELESIKSAVDSLNDIRSRSSDIAGGIEVVIKHLNELLLRLKKGNEFLDVFYTITRDAKHEIDTRIKGQLAAVTQETREIDSQLSALHSKVGKATP